MSMQTFPLFKNKNSFNSLVKIESQKEMASIALLSYDASLLELFSKEGLKKISHACGGIYLFNEKIMIITCQGIGGPAAVVALEYAYSMGVRKVISIGLCASINEKHKIADVLLIKDALRDEGVSYHYLDASREVASSESLVPLIKKFFRETLVSYKIARTWTIDAPFRETYEEIKEYASEGIDAVDMEAASIFAYGIYKKIEISSIFIVSDLFVENKWIVDYKKSSKKLQNLYQELVSFLLK